MTDDVTLLDDALATLAQEPPHGALVALCTMLRALGEEDPSHAERVAQMASLPRARDTHARLELVALLRPLAVAACRHVEVDLRRQGVLALRTCRALCPGDEGQNALEVVPLAQLLEDAEFSVVWQAACELAQRSESDLRAALPSLEAAASHADVRVRAAVVPLLTSQRVRAGLEGALSVHPSAQDKPYNVRVSVSPRPVRSDGTKPWDGSYAPFHGVAGCGHCAGGDWYYTYIESTADLTGRSGDAETYCRSCQTFTLFSWDW